MNIEAFNYLELIPQLLEEIKFLRQNTNVEKRWLNMAEVSTYIGYSKDRIYALTNTEFIEGKHYFKKGKLLFDKHELDNWVTHSNSKMTPKEIVNQVLKGLV